MRPIILFILSASWSHAAPRVADLSVVDLTTGAVRLVWNSGPNSRPEVDVFTNADGTLVATGVTNTPFSIFAGDSNAINLATAEGVQEIQVSGLAPDTTYYLRARSVTVPSGPSAQSGLIQVRTAVTPLLALSGVATPFANPVLSMPRPPSTAEYSSICTLLVITTPAARSGALALTGNPDTWFIDLNSLISTTTGTPLPLTPGTPLEATIHTGNAGARRFTLYAPASDQLAEVRSPALSPATPLNGAILAPVPGLLLMEFAAKAGDYYAVERSTSLQQTEWHEIAGATMADSDRFFFSTRDVAPPKAFFRTREVDVFAPE